MGSGKENKSGERGVYLSSCLPGLFSLIIISLVSPKGAGGGKTAPPKNSKDAATRPFVFVFFRVEFFSFCKSRICVKNNKYFTFNKSFSFVGVFPAEKGFVNCTRERAGPGVGFSFCWFGFAFGTFRCGSVRFASPF